MLTNRFLINQFAKNFGRISIRNYTQCCPPPNPPPCGCDPPKPPPCQGACPPCPGGGRRIVPPSDCCPGPIAPNPCCPHFHQGKDTWKKYRTIFFLVCVPLIIVQAFNALSHSPPHKTECRDYEYMRIRTKRFPWGDGRESLWHNPDVNFLPGECVSAPQDCD